MIFFLHICINHLLFKLSKQINLILNYLFVFEKKKLISYNDYNLHNLLIKN